MNCPHQECGKKFDQLIMLVDNAKVPRETYYACPHCKSRINIVVDSENLKFSKRSRRGNGGKESGCPYYFGYLKLFYNGDQIPEGCMLCSRLIECSDKKT